jgi:CRP-like cAMP-binding protein
VLSLCLFQCGLGDIGDNFYVVDSGKVEVYKKSPDGPDVKVTPTPSYLLKRCTFA